MKYRFKSDRGGPIPWCSDEPPWNYWYFHDTDFDNQAAQFRREFVVYLLTLRKAME